MTRICNSILLVLCTDLNAENLETFFVQLFEIK